MTRYYYEKYSTKTTLEEKMRKSGDFYLKTKRPAYFNGYRKYEIKNGKFSIYTSDENFDVFGMYNDGSDYKGTLYRLIRERDSYYLSPDYECDNSVGENPGSSYETIEAPYLYAVDYYGYRSISGIGYNYYRYWIYGLENVTRKGSFLDKFIAEERAYPTNGPKNGYWYVRGQKIVPELKNGSKSMQIETVIKIGGVFGMLLLRLNSMVDYTTCKINSFKKFILHNLSDNLCLANTVKGVA